MCKEFQSDNEDNSKKDVVKVKVKPKVPPKPKLGSRAKMMLAFMTEESPEGTEV